MRLGMVAESLLEFISLKARLVPVPLALTFGGLTVSRMLTTCARLGIFAELAKAPRTADELATALALDPEATARLLQALARRNGPLASENGRYRLGPTWAQWLDPESKQSVVHALAMFDDLWQIWADLPALLRDGARVDAYQGLLRQQETSTRFGGHDRDTLRRHLLGLAEMARHQAPSILKKPRLPKAPGRVLDVGTGHGEFAISIVRAHPGYQAVCYDLPLPCEVALERVRAAGLETQIAVKAGDLFEDSLRAVVGDDFNLALLFNVLHNLSEEQNRRALAEISRVMRPGGKLAVLEWLCQGAVPVSTGAAFMLQALFTTPGNAFRLNDVSSWLDAAGFKDVRGHAVASIPGTTLLIATRI